MNITVLSRDDSLTGTLRALLDTVAGGAHPRFVRDVSPAAWLDDIERLPRAHLRAVETGAPLPEADVPPVATSAATLAALPDVLILDRLEPDGGAFEAIERFTRRWPQLTVLLLSDGAAPALLMAAMRAGIREVVPLPLNQTDLPAALLRAGGRQTDAGSTHRSGKVLGFVACKGGSGATFMAANIAWALAAAHDKRVLLIDLDLQYGDASFFFMSGETATGSVASVVRDADRMDATLLAASCLQILPNLSLLPAPEEAEDVAAVTPAQLGRLLDLAAASYDYVLFDLNRSFDANALAALDRADLLFAIMQSMVPDMRDARTTLRAFRQLGYADSKLRFIVNRSDKKEDAPIKPIERGLGVDFYRTIPNDYLNASVSVNQGVSIIKLAPASPVTRVLLDIASNLAGTASGSENWFRKLLRRA